MLAESHVPRHGMAKSALPPCLEGQALRGDASPWGAEPRPCLADASLVLKWATGHHTEAEHGFHVQHTAGNGNVAGALEGLHMHLVFSDVKPVRLHNRMGFKSDLRKLPQSLDDQGEIIRTCGVRKLFAKFNWVQVLGGDGTRGFAPTAVAR